jgi:hypothetical protein
MAAARNAVLQGSTLRPHFVAAAGFRDRDLFDILHLVEPGRVKFRSIQSDKTIGLLTKYRMPAPSPTPTPSPTPSASPSPSLSPLASASAAPCR